MGKEVQSRSSWLHCSNRLEVVDIKLKINRKYLHCSCFTGGGFHNFSSFILDDFQNSNNHLSRMKMELTRMLLYEILSKLLGHHSIKIIVREALILLLHWSRRKSQHHFLHSLRNLETLGRTCKVFLIANMKKAYPIAAKCHLQSAVVLSQEKIMQLISVLWFRKRSNNLHRKGCWKLSSCGRRYFG